MSGIKTAISLDENLFNEVKETARWLIWELGQKLDARPASINDFYMARATAAWKDRTVPAMNIRFTTYDTARAAFRAALGIRRHSPARIDGPELKGGECSCQ